MDETRVPQRTDTVEKVARDERNHRINAKTFSYLIDFIERRNRLRSENPLFRLPRRLFQQYRPFGRVVSYS
jgi:hypothetical protein